MVKSNMGIISFCQADYPLDDIFRGQALFAGKCWQYALHATGTCPASIRYMRLSNGFKGAHEVKPESRCWPWPLQ